MYCILLFYAPGLERYTSMRETPSWERLFLRDYQGPMRLLLIPCTSTSYLGNKGATLACLPSKHFGL